MWMAKLKAAFLLPFVMVGVRFRFAAVPVFCLWGLPLLMHKGVNRRAYMYVHVRVYRCSYTQVFFSV